MADAHKPTVKTALSGNRLTGFFLTLLALTPVQFSQASVDGQVVDVFQSVPASIPRVCRDAIRGMSGLCLLASTQPKVSNQFMIAAVGPAGGRNNSPPQVLPFNRFVRLQPGEYLISSASGLDRQHELKVSISGGMVTSIKTGMILLKPGSKSHRLQHYQDESYSRGCVAEIMRSGALAVLPGNYQVTLVDRNTKTDADCLNTGVTFNVLAGRAVSSSPWKVRESRLPESNRYRHPNGVSSLANVGPFRADIERVDLIPSWRSLRGVHNPHRTAYSAIVLEGIGSHRFIVPFRAAPGKRQCGRSLPEGGMKSQVLLKDCLFRGSRLTQFTIASGSYYTLNNRHGKTAIEGNYLNNSILVKNVNFVMK